MIAYKVTTARNQSATAEILPRSLKIIYRPGKWVRPKIGKLFVFKNFEDAIKWAGSSPLKNYIIWKCEAKRARKLKSKVEGYWFSGAQSFKIYKAFWQDKKGLADVPPSGTYGCDGIKLLEKVYDQL